MPQLNAQNATVTAAEFLTRCFAPWETIALFLRREVPRATIQRIVPLETALAPRYLAWLAYENSAGANVYVAANPLRADSPKRTKECIASVRHLYLDLDTDGETRLSSLRASEAVPSPNAVLSTSLGNYQILWRVDGFTLEQQESALKLLAVSFGGDPACTDCNRVLRVPGFFNCKYDPAYPVTVEYPGDSTWNCDDFRLDILAADGILPHHPIAARKRTSNHTLPSTIGHGFCMSFPAAKTPPSLPANWLRSAPISPILFTTLSVRWTLRRPDFGSSKAFR